MPFSGNVYTPPTGATNATPGIVIRSATWNTINADVAAALTQVAQNTFNTTKSPVLVASTGTSLALTGEQTVDGVLTAASRVLCKDQSVSSENGIYVSAASSWARAVDWTTTGQIAQGSRVPVQQGTINQNSMFYVTTSGTITIGTTSVVLSNVLEASGAHLQAGTTVAAPLNFTSGTNLTTAAAGAVEYDGKCIYATAVAASRQVVDTEQFVTVQGSDVSLSNSVTTAQNIFASTSDVATLAATTSYFFESFYQFANGGTSHTTAIGYSVSSALTSISYVAELWSGGTGTISTTAPSILNVLSSNGTTLNAASTALFTQVRNKGIIRTNGATSLTPQVTFSAGPTGTCGTKVDSYFRIWPIGSNTVVAVGNWS